MATVAGFEVRDAYPSAEEHRNVSSHPAPLYEPYTLRGLTLRNRIVMSPMCQYVAEDGLASDWHLVHLGSRASGGVGLVIVEATAVEARGRITPGDTGIWDDRHVEPLARIVRFVESQGAAIGIQLAHAGRKGSCDVPWRGGEAIHDPAAGGWPVVGPSPIPFSETSPVPHELTEAEIRGVVDSFEAAARRALDAGFKTLEIHAAHGYLLHEFLSPISNRRTDAFGGTLENRTRFVRLVAERLRKVMPDSMPLMVRISATDWVDGGWDVDQSVELAKALKGLGVDVIDASSGALVPHAKIPLNPGYQVPFARRIRHEAGIATGAVGLITDAKQAEMLVANGDADLILLGRELLREPYWAIDAMQAAGREAPWPVSYGYVFKRR